ncbi:uncharacterized protein G2W53_001976 [Senna tora]|uniref:Uncharacterized protein n=1 Tax=Senna tora TaxID=362788 RepID=A0A835CKS8_9FABA|nr:uncharacterized protein G2W53_001976 [Senna tora]
MRERKTVEEKVAGGGGCVAGAVDSDGNGDRR